MNQPVQGGSLRRGLGLLTFLGVAGRPLGLSEFSASAELDKATTHRLAQVVVDCGFLTQDPLTRTYSLAPRVLDLGFGMLAGLDVRRLAQPYLRELPECLAGASVSLAVLDGADVVYIERVSQRRIAVNVDVEVGSRLPAHCSSMGKALLAALPADEFRAVLAALRLDPMTPSTITSTDRLETELRRVRSRGYAINDEETVRGLRSVAAAVRDAQGRPVAAVNVAVSAAEWTVDQLVAEAAVPVTAAASAISRHLGLRETAEARVAP